MTNFFKKTLSKIRTLFNSKQKIEKEPIASKEPIAPKEPEKSPTADKGKEVPYKPQGQTGLVCPQCQNKIPVSILNLLQDSAIMCPYCNLELKIALIYSLVYFSSVLSMFGFS